MLSVIHVILAGQAILVKSKYVLCCLVFLGIELAVFLDFYGLTNRCAPPLSRGFLRLCSVHNFFFVYRVCVPISVANGQKTKPRIANAHACTHTHHHHHTHGRARTHTNTHKHTHTHTTTGNLSFIYTLCRDATILDGRPYKSIRTRAIQISYNSVKNLRAT